MDLKNLSFKVKFCYITLTNIRGHVLDQMTSEPVSLICSVQHC